MLAFELENRVFAASAVSDRGEAYFEHFTDGLAGLLADQQAGRGAFYLLIENDQSVQGGFAVLGRFNLKFGSAPVAELGYRVAERACGQGVATATVRELCSLAATRYGVRSPRAATSHSNLGSQRVLIKAGFVPAGPAGPADLGGKLGTWYERDLTADPLVGSPG